jgi:pre-rRNA-processing protein TSR2
MHPNRANFLEGVRLIFGGWPVLKTAISEEWGGPESAEKVNWFVESLLEHFDERGTKIEQEELEDILLHVMGHEFNVVLEDESERFVASQVLRLFRESIKGESSLLMQLRQSSRQLSDLPSHSIPDSSSDEEVEDTD